MRLDYTEKAYLENSVVMEFLVFLGKLTSGRLKMECEYSPSRDKNNRFVVKSLKDGFLNYRWNGGYKENSTLLKKLSCELSKSLKNDDKYGTLVACLRVLVWGEVYKGSIGWLAKIGNDKQIVARIKSATKFFDGDSSEKINLFDDNMILRSDSGTTKIFSLAAKRSIIYDNRVACALGMLVIDFLKSHGYESVPDELDFLMDVRKNKGRNQNPRVSGFSFTHKGQIRQKGCAHAISNLKANWLLKSVCASNEFNWELGFTTEGTAEDTAEERALKTKMRALEASLFMVGYKSLDKKFEETGFYLYSA